MLLAPHHMPGIISVPISAIYACYAEKGIDLDAKITDHITAWAATVPVGTTVTVDEMLINPAGDCGCSFVFGWHSSKCKGSGHGMPMEIVMALLFPPDGTPCAIPGVKGVATHGPLSKYGLGLIKYIQKTG